MTLRAAALGATLFVFARAATALAQQRAPQPIEAPKWFSDSFLDVRDDLRDASAAGRRLVVYFAQDGCPYCAKMMVTSFSQRRIVEKMRRHFVAIALDIWGAREVTWLDGAVMTEKELARRLDVQFTPTLLFFDARGDVVARLNGYYPPHLFDAALDYAAAERRNETLGAYLGRAAKPPASARLADDDVFIGAPYDLTRERGGRPLAVVFETTSCAECDELHRDVFARAEIRSLLSRFDVARLALGASTAITTADGRATNAADWAKALDIAYTPTIVFFDDRGSEVFRIDAYLRPFHLASALDYVASGAYRDEPSFQRFIQSRAERQRARGERIDLWR
jgi:thioredoxin-related protein